VTASDIQRFIQKCQEKNLSPSYADLCLATAKTTKEQLTHWPKVVLEKEPKPKSAVEELQKPPWPKTLTQANHRIDISATLGTWVKEWSIFNQSSMINVYTGQISLIKSFFSLFEQAFYSKDQFYFRHPQILNELAQWFGVEHLVVSSPNDPVEKYQKAGWSKLSFQDGIEIWSPAEQNSYFSLTSKPVFLVIGSFKSRAYEQIFRLANLGVLPYKEALLVEGKASGRLDDYSLSELKQFDGLILYGYSYKNPEKALRLLEQYLKQGGRLFINTGWQGFSADWENPKTPSFFPVESLKWGNLGKVSGYKIESQEIAGGVDPSQFSPLIWEDKPWGLSLPGHLRDWARPVLSVSGHPLVAVGEYGQGKVIWAGFDLFAHARDKENFEEVTFLRNLFHWLIGQKEAQEFAGYQFQRENPDQIKFVFNKEINQPFALYFKEAYAPWWRAFSIQGGKKEELSIFPAGPRFILVRIPAIQRGGEVVLEFRPRMTDQLAKVLSVFTLILLLGLVLDSLWLRGKILVWLKSKLPRFKTRKPALITSVKQWWQSE
jgi:hypothetical protein